MSHTVQQLEQQIEKIQKYLEHCMQSLFSSSKQVLNQLIKRCQIIMHNAVILTKKNKKLKAANVKQK